MALNSGFEPPVCTEGASDPDAFVPGGGEPDGEPEAGSDANPEPSEPATGCLRRR